MATISKTGISQGGTIQPTHITNIIDALDGTSATTTIIATGSFSGSLVGIATSASYATTASYALNAAAASSFPYTGSAIISGSLMVTGSLNVSGGVTASLLGSASYATTASYALNAGGGTGVGFPFSGSAQVTGSMGITGSLQVTAGITGSLLGSASYAVNVGVVRTSTAATFYPTFVDSSNATTGSEQMYTAAAITVAPDRGFLQATSVSGSITGSILAQGSLRTSNGATTTLSGSLNGTVTGAFDLVLSLTELGKSGTRGYFAMPKQVPTYYDLGTMYVDLTDPPTLNVWDGSSWRTLTFT